MLLPRNYKTKLKNGERRCSMKSNLVTREDVQKTFNDAFEQMKNYYMLMDVDDQYYYFKHKLTRQYIKIEREGEK